MRQGLLCATRRRVTPAPEFLVRRMRFRLSAARTGPSKATGDARGVSTLAKTARPVRPPPGPGLSDRTLLKIKPQLRVPGKKMSTFQKLLFDRRRTDAGAPDQRQRQPMSFQAADGTKRPNAPWGVPGVRASGALSSVYASCAAPREERVHARRCLGTPATVTLRASTPRNRGCIRRGLFA
jgi:hypothetical protein